MNTLLRYLKHSGIAAALAILAACSTLDTSPDVTVERDAEWVMLPFSNATETPLAGQRAEAVTASIARSMGITRLQRYPQSLQDDSLFEAGQGRSFEQALGWAREHGARYAISGTVQEWRYKVGVDGEAVVGLSLQLIEVTSGRVIWSGVGARTGWGRQSLSAVAQKLTRQLLEAGLDLP